MGIMTCPKCKGEKVVNKETGLAIAFVTGVTSTIEEKQCPECKGLGYLDRKVW